MKYHPRYVCIPRFALFGAARYSHLNLGEQYLLTNFASIEEIRDALAKVQVVPVVEPALGFAPPVHFIVTEPNGTY